MDLNPVLLPINVAQRESERLFNKKDVIFLLGPAGTAKTHLKKMLHVGIWKSPDVLFNLNPERLADQAQAGCFIHTCQGIFKWNLITYLMFDNGPAAIAQEKAADLLREMRTFIGITAYTGLRWSDITRLPEHIFYEVNGKSNAFTLLAHVNIQVQYGDCLHNR